MTRLQTYEPKTLAIIKKTYEIPKKNTLSNNIYFNNFINNFFCGN